MPSLFDPLQAGALSLKNRVVMAPLTRSRAGGSRIPNALMAEYYAQRAGAGLIISEATAISEEGYGWKDAPGAYTQAQMDGWKRVTDSVHKAGGIMVLQLWHMGRLSHSGLIGGRRPLAPSALAAPGEHRSVHKPYEVPQAMTLDDIKRTVDDYAACAGRAVAAGFDGVEIHGANGYLIDQFLRDGSNKRDDVYGGGTEHRARFMEEVTQAVVSAVGSDRTGMRLTAMNLPWIEDSCLEGTMVHAASVLDRFRLAYLHVREKADECAITPKMRKVYRGVLIGNDSYDGASAQAALDQGIADAVAFGAKFIANPDLPERLRAGAPLNTPDQPTFYKGGAEGYTDYPFLKSEAA